MLAFDRGGQLGKIRTGAASGLAKRLLARADTTPPRSSAPAGRRARSRGRMACPADHRCVCRAVMPNTRRSFARDSAKLGIEVEPPPTWRAWKATRCRLHDDERVEAVPLRRMLESRTHVNAAGSHRRVRGDRPRSFDRAGDRGRGNDRAGESGIGRSDRCREGRRVRLVARGHVDRHRNGCKTPGRTSDDQITLFESLGIAALGYRRGQLRLRPLPRIRTRTRGRHPKLAPVELRHGSEGFAPSSRAQSRTAPQDARKATVDHERSRVIADDMDGRAARQRQQSRLVAITRLRS